MDLPTLRVVARVRPTLKPEAAAAASVALLGPTALQVTQLEKNTLKRSNVPGEPPSQVIYKSTQPFSFDRVWWQETDTTTLHAHEVEPLVSAVLRGEGVTSLVLAYGQTASGKTFTLTGSRAGPGILQIAADQIMASVAAGNAAGHEGRYAVYVTAGEIYMENLLDLATAGSKDKKLTAATLRRLPIASESADELIRTLEGLSKRRAEGATNNNEHSSRSHAVYCVHVEYRVPANPALRRAKPPPACLLGGAPESSEVSVMPVGTFGVCDLAGAEYAAATEGREGERRLEGGRNNLGLMSLKAAFRYLGDSAAARAAAGGGGAPPPLPPFSWSRSTLTRILRPFFTTPGSQLLMLVTASPDDADAAQTAQALTEGVLIAGRPLMPRSVVEVGPAPLPSGRQGGGASSARSAPAAPKRPILRAGSGHGGGQAVAAARAAIVPSSARANSAVGGRR